MRLDDLTDLMDELSRRTWFNLTEARRLKMRMGEVTLTEMNLLAIAQMLETSKLKLKVELVATRKDESKTGTDFEIWLRNRRGRIFGYSVQAKVIRVKGSSYEYPELGHTNANGVQMDLLERRALTVGSYPIHLLFNGWETPQKGEPALPSGRDTELFGCAAVQTSVVRDVRTGIGKGNGINRAAPYLARSMPWSDLFRVSGSSSGGGSRGSSGGGPRDGDGGTGLTPFDPDEGGNPMTIGPQPDDQNPTRSISMTASDLNALEARLSRLGGESFEPRPPPGELPADIVRARGVPRDQLVDSEENASAPLFALIIEE